MQQRTGALLVLASAVAFGVMPIFGKLAFEAGVGVATLLFVRFALATPVLWAAAAVARACRATAARCCGRSRSARSATRCRPACTSSPSQRMDASVLSLVLYSYPALVTGAAILLRRESANRRAARRPRHRVGRAGARARRRGPRQPRPRGLRVRRRRRAHLHHLHPRLRRRDQGARAAAAGRAGVDRRDGHARRRRRRHRLARLRLRRRSAGSGSGSRRSSAPSSRSSCSSAG